MTDATNDCSENPPAHTRLDAAATLLRLAAQNWPSDPADDHDISAIGTDPWCDISDPDEAHYGANAASDTPGTSVIDRAALDEAIRVSGYDGSFETLSGAEEQRIRLLLAYRDDPKLRKTPLVATPAMIECLDALGREQPNFRAVTDLVQQALKLSLATGFPLRVPPLLLLGQPGTGKSRYARSLAAALATTIEAIDGAAIPDTGSISGFPPIYRASGPGYAARALVRSPTMNPVIMVDEIEKIIDFDRNPHPENRLLALLEQGTAAVWMDEFLRVPMRADGVIWLFTANSTTRLSAPFLDRVVTLRIPGLPRTARDTVLEAMLGEVAGECGAAITLENRDALGPVRPLGLRRARLAFGLAVACTVADGRRVIERADLAQAASLLRRRACKAPAIADEPRLKAPLGFIDLRARRRGQRDVAGSPRVSATAL